MPVNYEPNKVATDPLAQYIAELKTQKTKEKQIKEAKSKSFLRKMGEGIVRPFAEVGASVYNVGGAIGQLASGDEEGARQTLQQSRNLPFVGETKPAFTGEESAGQFAKKVGGYGLEIGSTVMGGGGTAGVAKAGLKGLVKEGLKTGVKAGFASGLTGGAGMSLKEDKSAGEVLLSSLMGGAFGTVAGGVLGAATPVVGKAARSVLLPVEQKISNTLRSAIDKGIKPYFTNSSKAFKNKYYQNAEKAFLTIFENKPKIMSEELGEEVAKLPTNRAEMLEALYKTKQAIYNQFHQVAVDAGDAGAKFDVGDIISNLDGVVQSKKYSPDIRNYAESLKAELGELAGEAPEVIEARIQDLNNSLGGFYEGRVSKAKAQVDASVAKLMREKLDGIIEKATGEPYQVLKNKYGALKTVEKDLARQVANEARKAQKGLIDFTDIFTGGDLITGVVTGNPLLFAKGLAGKGIKEYMKFMNNPNRFIKEAFDVLDNPPADIRGMLNKAGEYINTHAGLSIQDITNDIEQKIINAQKIAAKNKPELLNKLNEVFPNDKVSSRIKGTTPNSPVESVIKKVLKHKGNVDELYDILGTKVVTSEKNIQNAIRKIKSNFDVVDMQSVEQYTRKGEWPYDGINFKIKLKDGSNAEIQLHTPDSNNISNATHEFYKKWEYIPEEKMTSQQKIEYNLDRQKAFGFAGDIKIKLTDTNLDDILSSLTENGGITYDVIKKQNLGATKNYSVSLYPERSVILDNIKREDLVDFIKNNRDLLSQNGNSLGGWFDVESGKYYLDVSYVTPDLTSAINLGKKYNQKAIYDLRKFEEIPTSGTGENIGQFGDIYKRIYQ